MAAQSLTAPRYGLTDHDNAMRAQVARMLRSYPHPALRSLHVTALCGRVILGGDVPTYYLKQLAQSFAMSVEGVEGIENHVAVV